jgi:DnaK suppressor protein
MLVERYDVMHAMWVRQRESVELLRDSIDDGGADPVDRATLRARVEEEALLTAGLREQLDDLSTALQRYDDGRYGICRRCGSQIPGERLQMFPAATHCVPCKQADQRR